jgi:hypothetical protein
VNGDPAHVVSPHFDLAGVEPDANLDALGPELLADGQGAADRPGGPIEQDQEPITRRLDLASSVPGKRSADHRVMAVKQVPPSPVADRGRALGRRDDIAEHHSG